ncbi:NusG antitermination factor [Hyphomicrobium denitrificans 1NES1]|uniref:NusG antitermination factor n=2 Tax=Hyphomicrobium denitrificans TaxID=53399 RepID=N0AZN6_9HYPH|nr:NusG antitermination factor [Hyphomicrobium denitrificans 1NES1]
MFAFMTIDVLADWEWKKCWIVVNTQANREFIAASNLKNQGYDVYAPVIRKQTRHARICREILAPLFPGYLFVRWNAPDMRWRPILSTVGIRTIVRNGDEPGRLDGEIVEALKARERDGVVTRAASPREIGQTVRFACGPFDGLAAEIIELCDRDRLVVLMTLLNRPTKVTVLEDQLSAC